jgi:dolichol-phosphate mannosyltransferase
MSLVSVVVPVYHNAPSLPDLLSKLQEVADAHPGDRFEFVFVDDGSRDESFEVLQSLAGTEPRMRIVKLSRNFGSNAAVLAGLAQARGDAIAAVSADLQDPPELIGPMLAEWREGRKVVLAARRRRADGMLTALMADAFYGLFRRYAIATMPRRGFDFFLIDRRVCDLIDGIQENNAYLMGLILWLGFEPAVIHYDRRARAERYGRSMWTLTRKLKYFADSFVAFSYAPLRLSSAAGMALSVLGLGYAALVVARRLLFGEEVEGWASLMVVLLIVSGAQLVILGVLGEYLWRSLDETRRRPRFVIDRIVEGAAAAEVNQQPLVAHTGGRNP